MRKVPQHVMQLSQETRNFVIENTSTLRALRQFITVIHTPRLLNIPCCDNQHQKFTNINAQAEFLDMDALHPQYILPPNLHVKHPVAHAGAKQDDT
jgi:hypothetical protein